MSEARDSQGSRNYIRSIVVIAIFSALAAAGGLIKLPSPVGSIALDSASGFFVAGFFSPVLGGITGFLGHLASSGIAGFPLAIAHVPVAVMQFLWCFIFGYIVRKGQKMWALIFAAVVAVLANGILAPVLLSLLFPDFRNSLNALIPFLLVASALNLLLACLAIKVLAKVNIPGL